MAAFKFVRYSLLLLFSLGCAWAQLLLSSSDGSPDLQFATLKEAWDAAANMNSPEIVITLLPGTYYLPDTTYILNGDIKHIAQTTATISPSFASATSTTQPDRLILQGDAVVTFEGVEFRDFAYKWPVPDGAIWCAFKLNPSSNLVFKNSNFTGKIT